MPPLKTTFDTYEAVPYRRLPSSHEAIVSEIESRSIGCSTENRHVETVSSQTFQTKTSISSSTQCFPVPIAHFSKTDIRVRDSSTESEVQPFRDAGTQQQTLTKDTETQYEDESQLDVIASILVRDVIDNLREEHCRKHYEDHFLERDSDARTLVDEILYDSENRQFIDTEENNFQRDYMEFELVEYVDSE